jgi:hypothetical protein
MNRYEDLLKKINIDFRIFLVRRNDFKTKSSLNFSSKNVQKIYRRKIAKILKAIQILTVEDKFLITLIKIYTQGQIFF